MPTLPVLLGYSPSNNAANCDLDALALIAGQTGSIPGDGRTVPTLGDYLDNNALYNIEDYGATGGADDTVAIAACYAAANAAAKAGNGVTVLWPKGRNYRTTAQIRHQNPYMTTLFEGGAVCVFDPPPIVVTETVSGAGSLTGADLTFSGSMTGRVRKGTRLLITPVPLGTVTIAGGTGAATFSLNQRAIILDGTQVVVGGVTLIARDVAYDVSGLNGTTTCILKEPLTGTVAANVVGAAFTVAPVNYIMTDFTAAPGTAGKIGPNPAGAQVNGSFAASTFLIAQSCFRLQVEDVAGQPVFTDIQKNAIIGARFFSSPSLVPKTAIEVVVGTQTLIRDITCVEQAWDCPGGIGLHSAGHEFLFVDNFSFATEQPILCTKNLWALAADISMDAYSFRNLYLIGRGAGSAILGGAAIPLTTRALMYVEPDVTAYRVHIEHMECPRGTYGLYINTAVALYNWTINGFWREQTAKEGNDLYALFIQGGSQFSLTNILLGGAPVVGIVTEGNRGASLALSHSRMSQAQYEGTTEVLKLYATDFEWQGLFAQQNAVLTLAGACVLTKGQPDPYSSRLCPSSGRVDLYVDAGSVVATPSVALRTAPGKYQTRMTENNVKEFAWSGTLAQNQKINVPLYRLGTSDAFNVAEIRIRGYTATGPVREYGTFYCDREATGLIAELVSANCQIGAAANKLSATYDAATFAPAEVVTIENGFAETLAVLVTAQWG